MRRTRRLPRRVRPAHRHSAGDQGPVLHRGRAHHCRQPDPRSLHSALRKHGQRQSAARRRGVPRQVEHGRIRHGLVEHDIGLWRGDKSLAAPAGPDGGAGSRRFVGRFGGRGVGAAGDGGNRDRHRWLDPPARIVLRRRRDEADLWAVLALGRGGVRVIARPSRPVRAHGGRLRDPARFDGRARSEGFHQRRPSCAGLRGRMPARREGTPDRRAARVPHGRNAGRHRAPVATGAGLAARCRRGDRRRLAAAHEIRAYDLLHRGAGGGFVEPGAL